MGEICVCVHVGVYVNGVCGKCVYVCGVCVCGCGCIWAFMCVSVGVYVCVVCVSVGVCVCGCVYMWGVCVGGNCGCVGGVRGPWMEPQDSLLRVEVWVAAAQV